MDVYSTSSDEEVDDDLARVRESMKKGAASTGTAGLERTSELEEWWNDFETPTRSESTNAAVAAATSTSNPSRQQQQLAHPPNRSSSFSFESPQENISPGVPQDAPPMSPASARSETARLSQRAPRDAELFASTSRAAPSTNDDEDDEGVWNDASIWEELDRRILRVSGPDDGAKDVPTDDLKGTSPLKPEASRSKEGTEFCFPEHVLESVPFQSPAAKSSDIGMGPTELSSMNKSPLRQSGSQASDSTSDASFGKKTQANHQLMKQKKRGRESTESPFRLSHNRTSNDDSSLSDSSTSSSRSSLSSSLSEFRRKNGLRSTVRRLQDSASSAWRDDDDDASSNDGAIPANDQKNLRSGPRRNSTSSSSSSDSVTSSASTPSPSRRRVQQLTIARSNNTANQESNGITTHHETGGLRGHASNEGSQRTVPGAAAGSSLTVNPSSTQRLRDAVDPLEATSQKSFDSQFPGCSEPRDKNAELQTKAGAAEDDSLICQDDLVRFQRRERERQFTLSNAFGLDDADPQYEDDSVKTEPNFSMSPQRHSSESGERCMSEIDPVLFAPPSYQVRPTPIVHEFTTQNRPRSQRRCIGVAQLFPDLNLWSTKFDTFNELQSEIANTLAYRCVLRLTSHKMQHFVSHRSRRHFSDDNLVVSAPTGAGT